MEPAGIEPATSGLQSLAQGGPFTEKISIYTGFVRISEAPHSTDTDQIRISTYPVTYPPTVHSMKLPTPGVAREPNADRDCSNRLLGGWRAYDAEAAPPHSDPQLRTRRRPPPPFLSSRCRSGPRLCGRWWWSSCGSVCV